jgi:hypothetical protein
MQIFLATGLTSHKYRFMNLIVVLEGATPSAQVLVVTLNQLGIGRIASSLSYMYIYMYLLSTLTVTFWIMIAMVMFY